MTAASPPEAARRRPTVRFLGLDFTTLPDEEVLAAIREMAEQERFSYVITPNVDHVVKLNQPPFNDPAHDVNRAYADATLHVCDSQILAKLARASRIDLPVFRGSGSNMTRLFLEQNLRVGYRVALVGGTEAQLLWLESRWPEVKFVQHVPPMGVLTNPAAQEAIAQFVEEARCDLVLFALGAPQSEMVCGQIWRRGRARGVALCIGASIEFLSGAKRYAPRWVHDYSLEWAFRLVTEPRRLWRRYLVDGPRIFAIWWRQRRRSEAN